MMKKDVQDYLNKTPRADIFDVMFTFPGLTMDEAYRATWQHRFMRAVRYWWLLLVVVIAIIVIVLLYR